MLTDETTNLQKSQHIPLRVLS